MPERTHLVLTRNVEESIMIGDDVEVRVERIGRDRVRLSVFAPRDVVVRRKEVPDERKATGQIGAAE